MGSEQHRFWIFQVSTYPGSFHHEVTGIHRYDQRYRAKTHPLSSLDELVVCVQAFFNSKSVSFSFFFLINLSPGLPMAL